MTLAIRPRSVSVNRQSFLAGLLLTVSWQAWNLPVDASTKSVVAALCAGAALPIAIKVTVASARDWRLRHQLAKTLAVSDDHGSGREASWEELVAVRMHAPASGNFLGLETGQRPVFAPPKTPFGLIEMPPGVGKTVNLVIGSILHQARLGKSLFIPDVKTELAPILVKALKDLGIEVWCVNPAKVHEGLCPDTELNLYQPVLDAAQDLGAFRQDTVKLALDLADLHLPEPKGGDDKNVFFRNGSRRCISVAILSRALLAPALCTPSNVFALLNDPAALRKTLIELRYELPHTHPNDAVAAFLRTEAMSLLDRFQNNEEHGASFLEGATQALLSFNHGGRLAGYGRTASVNIADLRKRQIAVFIMAPLSHARDFAPLVSLLNHGLLEASKRNPIGHPVHIVGEEALNYRFADIVSDMETMRGLKLSADFYIQSFDGLVRKYGREAASAIESYADVKIYAGLNSFARAKHVSDMLAEGTIRRQDFSYQAEAQGIGVSSREQGRRLMTPDEILAMPRGQAWVFVRGLRPLRVTMVDYGRVTPWRGEVADNPLEGSRLCGDPVFAIRYPGKGGAAPIIEGMRYRTRTTKARRKIVWPVQLRHLLWLPPLLGVWMVVPADPPLPHLLWRYERSGTGEAAQYRHCAYLGPYGRTLDPADGACPLVRLLPPEGAV